MTRFWCASNLIVALACVVLLLVLQTTGVGATAQPDKFTCLDGSKTISATQVNDDYCDCADGSDEPDTSACIMIWGERLITKQKNTMFRCTNTAGFEQNVPFHWLNDGFCDCCDGSDEDPLWVKCPNTCGEAARLRAEEAQREENMRKAAAKIKAGMVKAATKAKAALVKELPKTEREVATLEKELEKERATLAAAEKKEYETRETMRKAYEEWRGRRRNSTSGCVGWVQTVECNPAAGRDRHGDADCFAEISHGRSGYCECRRVSDDADAGGELHDADHPSPTPEDTDSDVQKQQSEEAGYNTETEEALLDEDEDPLDDFGANQLELSASHDDDGDLEDSSDTPTETAVARKLHNQRTRYNFTCSHDTLQCAYVCEKKGEAGVFADLVEPPSHHGYTLPEAQEAREKVNDLTTKVATATQKVEEMKRRSASDFSTEDLLLTLEGQSFKYDFQEYTYELKLFDGAWQNPKGGASASGTCIGRWGSFAENTYSSWAKDKFDYSQMNYPKGDRCWNGIVRSTDVRIVCGAENKLTHVEEPAMCQYHLVFETPAICEE